MIIDQKLLDELTAQAQASPRLRMNRDLRNFPSDQSQRMLNAIEPLGFFELTDLVMNTVGAFVGALVSAGVRKVVAGRKSRVICEEHV